MTASTDLDEATKRVDRYLDSRSADDLIDWNGGGLGPELLASDLRLLLAALEQVTTQRDEIQANRDALAHKVAEQRAVIARARAICAEPDDTQWWPVQPYMDPPNEDEVVEVQVIAADRLLAVLDGADTTTTDGSEA